MILNDTSKFLSHFVATLLAATMLVAPLPAQAAVGNCVVTTSLDNVDPAPIGSLRECSEKLGSQGFEDGISVTFNVDSVSLVAPVVFPAPSVAYSVAVSGPVEITQAMEFTPVDWIGESVFFDRPLYFLDGIVTLDNLTVTDALDGAVYVGAAELHVMNSTFKDNSTRSASLDPDGAAIYSSTAITTIENSAFSGNASDSDGGAIWADNNASIATSHFENNSAQEDGGALSVDWVLDITRSSFVGNSALGVGGAVTGAAEDSSDESYIFHSTFYDNSAQSGGAIYQVDEDVMVSFSTFVDNSASFSGSAIYANGEDVTVFGSIFANSEPLDQFQILSEVSQIYSAEDTYDYGGNVLTGSLETDRIDNGFGTIFPDEAGPWVSDNETLVGVSYDSLELGELTELSNGTYAFTPRTDSIAGDLVDPDTVLDTFEVLDWAELSQFSALDTDYFLGITSTGFIVDQSGEVAQGMISAGSIDFDASLQPVPYLGPVVTNDPETAQSGSTVTYSGSDLDEVTSATIAGQSAAIVSKTASALTLRVPAGLNQGMHDVVLHYSTTESLTLQNGLVVQDLMKVWTQLQSDNTVKMYAKNIVGVGKIQFFHNNNEIAWVRASNALNPKLRQANGSSYLVRTRELEEGKNAFEIYDDGKRIWRAAYAG